MIFPHQGGRPAIASDRGRHAGPRARTITQVEIPGRTIARVILILTIIWLLTRLWSILLLGFIAVLVAAALFPLVRRLQARGVPRPAAVGVVILGLVAGLVALVALLVPPLIDEGRAFAQELPSRVDQAERLLKQNPDLYDRLRRASEQGAADPASIFGGFLTVGAGVVSGIANLFVVLVLAVYILMDGERIYAWLVRYLHVDQRERLDCAIPEVIGVVSGYVAGQLLTSFIFGVYTFALLTILGVPQALFLAIVAAFADAIPIAGVIIATVPAVLLAATVSWPAAAIVLAGYLIYQQIENYVIVPRVYKNTLQISSFAVLIAVLIGGELLGIVGVLLALPIAAAVPVIERIWIGDDHPWRARARRRPPEPAPGPDGAFATGPAADG